MPQVEPAIVKERARRLRSRGEQRLDHFLESEKGATRSILVETDRTGRTEHFAPVKFVQAMTPGAIVRAEIMGRGPTHLEARPSA
jgi:threonylcarbamoyladenosine tRNA methylthiotransferase MtaB